MLTSTLSISNAEAGRRVHAYDNSGPRRSMLGEELGPIRPVLAEAVASGDVSAEKAAHDQPRTRRRWIGSGSTPPISTPARNSSPTTRERFGPEDLRQLTQRVVDAINPDGSKPKEDLNRDRRWFEIHPTKDGGYIGEFRLTEACGAKLQTLLTPVSKIRVDESGQSR